MSTVKKKLICMGDSITEGYGLTSEQSYPSVLQKKLGIDYEVMNAGVTAHCVINERMPDGRILGLPYAGTERYAQALAAKGDIYVVLLGTNDAQDGVFDDLSGVDACFDIFSYREKFITHYESILEDIRRANPDARIFAGRPVPVLNCIWPKHQQKYLDVILDKLDEIGRRNPDVIMIDFFTEFMSKGDAWLSEHYQPDGLHPGPDGARLIADMVVKAVT